MGWAIYQALFRACALVALLSLLLTQVVAGPINQPRVQLDKPLNNPPPASDTILSTSPMSLPMRDLATTRSQKRSSIVSMSHHPTGQGGANVATGNGHVPGAALLQESTMDQKEIPANDLGAAARFQTPVKRTDYNPTIPHVAPPSYYLAETFRQGSNAEREVYQNELGNLAEITASPGLGPENERLAQAVETIRNVAGGFTATRGGDTRWALELDRGIDVTVMFTLPSHTPQLSMTTEVLAYYIDLALDHRRRYEINADYQTTIFLAEVQIVITSDDPPPYSANPSLPLLEDPAIALPTQPLWFMPLSGCQFPQRRSVMPSPSRRRTQKRCVRKCKDRQDGACKEDGNDTGHDDSATVPISPSRLRATVPRRDNESVWIDPATGWQAVQVSHAAGRLGYNISLDLDYLSVGSSDLVVDWAQRIERGDCSTTKIAEQAIAGMIFGCKKPSPTERDYARLCLAGEHEAAAGMLGASKTNRLSKRACRGDLKINDDHAASKDAYEEAYVHLRQNGLNRLPNNWNSLKIKSVYLSWSANNGCRLPNYFCPPRFDDGNTPSFEEAQPYFRQFLDTADWGQQLWLLKWLLGKNHSCQFKNALFGQIEQTVCISNRPKGCS